MSPRNVQPMQSNLRIHNMIFTRSVTLLCKVSPTPLIEASFSCHRHLPSARVRYPAFGNRCGSARRCSRRFSIGRDYMVRMTNTYERSEMRLASKVRPEALMEETESDEK